MRKLDIVPRSNPIRGRYRLDFREIRQKEFKEIIKKILYSHCQTKAMGSIKGELRGFRRFAGFMHDRFPEVRHFTEISRDMIEDYLVYIKTDTGLTSVSYTTELSVLDNLLDEIGRELEIENLCNLFLSSDCRAYDNALPEAYSDAEIRRFNSALTKLKPQLGRCLIIHQMLGTRIEDTLTLRRDCLSEKSGHYFITIVQQKTRKYKRPVSDQLAELIRKAIEVSEKDHPDSEYIFLQDNGKLYTDSMLKYHVSIMIYENDIRDDNGNYFEFRTHRFRHTFGVKLTEMKLDDDSIARLLGHKDTRTIPHYRRLRNEPLACGMRCLEHLRVRVVRAGGQQAFGFFDGAAGRLPRSIGTVLQSAGLFLQLVFVQHSGTCAAMGLVVLLRHSPAVVLCLRSTFCTIWHWVTPLLRCAAVHFTA